MKISKKNMNLILSTLKSNPVRGKASVRVSGTGTLCVVEVTSILPSMVAMASGCAEGEMEPIWVNFKKLTDACKASKKDTGSFELSVDGACLMISSDSGITRISEESGNREIPNDVNHLARPFLEIVGTIGRDNMLAGFDYCLGAVSGDDTRPHLRAVRIEDGNMVTTDGHRLHICRVGGNVPSITIRAAMAVMVRDACKVLNSAVIVSRKLQGAGATGNLDITVMDGEVGFSVFGYENNSDFPPYLQVVEPSRKNNFFETEVPPALRNLVKGAKGDSRIRIDFDSEAKELTLTLNREDTEQKAFIKGVESWPVEVIKFDARYLDQAFEGADKMHLATDGLDPLRVTGPNGREAVIMPMRV